MDLATFNKCQSNADEATGNLFVLIQAISDYSCRIEIELAKLEDRTGDHAKASRNSILRSAHQIASLTDIANAQLATASDRLNDLHAIANGIDNSVVAP